MSRAKDLLSASVPLCEETGINVGVTKAEFKELVDLHTEYITKLGNLVKEFKSSTSDKKSFKARHSTAILNALASAQQNVIKSKGEVASMKSRMVLV